jgi:hypothetical protein
VRSSRAQWQPRAAVARTAAHAGMGAAWQRQRQQQRQQQRQLTSIRCPGRCGCRTFWQRWRGSDQRPRMALLADESVSGGWLLAWACGQVRLSACSAPGVVVIHLKSSHAPSI